MIRDEYTAKIEQHKQVLTDARLGLETISSGGDSGVLLTIKNSVEMWQKTLAQWNRLEQLYEKLG